MEAELHQRFARRVWLYGMRHLRDGAAADDLTQRVLVHVIESLRAGRVREPEKLGSYVLGTARMMARDLRRDEARRGALLDRFGPKGAQVEAEPLLDLDRLRGCLEALPPREQTVVALSFYAELDADEIGAQLGMSANHVRVARHRGLHRLKDCMGVEA